MLVRQIMTHEVVALGPDTPIKDLQVLMELRDIRHFPILANRAGEGAHDELVGIVSDRDLRLIGADHPKSPVGVVASDPVSAVMNAPVVTAHPEDPVEEAAVVLRSTKVGALPVLENGRLVGIVTSSDMLEALIVMAGFGVDSSRVEVEVPNRPGTLAELLTYLSRHDLNVNSVMTTRRDEDAITFALRIGVPDGNELANQLREAGFSVEWPRERGTE